MQGEWLGSWPGEWFGDGVERPPGSISGTATISVTAAGTLQAPSGFMSGSASFSVVAVGAMLQDEGGDLLELREAVRRAAQERADADVIFIYREDARQAAISQRIALEAISTAQETSAESERIRKDRNRAAMLAALLLMQ